MLFIFRKAPEENHIVVRIIKGRQGKGDRGRFSVSFSVFHGSMQGDKEPSPVSRPLSPSAAAAGSFPSFRIAKTRSTHEGHFGFLCRSGGIRTRGLLVPNQTRYQTALHLEAGADEGTRTPDLLITNRLLYQLSHIGTTSNAYFIKLLSFCPAFFSHMPEALFQRGLRSQIGFRFHGAMISAGIRAAVTNQLPVPPGSDRSRGCPYESGLRSGGPAGVLRQ